MLGRNHAVSAAAGWAAAGPVFPLVGLEPATDPLLYAASIALAGGAGVIPDLDHPDARPAAAFGLVSRLVARLTAKAAGGHRKLTHSVPFAIGLGTAVFAAGLLPFGNWVSGVLVWGMTVFSGSLLGPSLGFRPSPVLLMASGAAAGWAVAVIEVPLTVGIRWALPFIIGGGCLLHILGDWLTKGGVPLLLPFSKKRWAAGLFRTGSGAETAVGLLSAAGLAGAAAYHLGLAELVAGWAAAGMDGEWITERGREWWNGLSHGAANSLGIFKS